MKWNADASSSKCIPETDVKPSADEPGTSVMRRCRSRKCKQRRSSKPSRICAILFAQFFVFNVTYCLYLGAERLLKVLVYMHRFKEMPMTVCYNEEKLDECSKEYSVLLGVCRCRIRDLYLENSRCAGTQILQAKADP
ncbi:hypothetical protein Bca52824_083841 [Brassica carinata]|uniref:Uncharacterized protein n=1 Tax=Brassica carinata TaxID=52824 RepID=A0A8X7PM71_BRACI|nr:hypothetical protein Bca52824_083841 [Brassica carinata]